MDIVSLKDFFLVSIPETFLSVLIGVIISKGRSYIDYSLAFITKLLTSVIFISVLLIISRSYNTSFIIITLTSLLIYILGFKLIWKFNSSLSILNGLIVLHILMLSENLTVQPLYSFIVSMIENYNFFDARIWWSIPTRIIQIITLIILFKLNFTLKNNPLFKFKFKDLKYHRKITISILLTFLTWSIFLNANYASIFITIVTNNLPNDLFKANLYNILFSTIVFLSYAIISFIRTVKYEGYKDIGDRSPEELFPLMLSVSNCKQREKFRKMLQEYEAIDYTKEVN